MSSASAVSVQALEAGYQGQAVFSDVSFSVTEGERVAIAGRNGSGKTTLFRVLCALHRPMTGKVQMLGRDAIREHPWDLVGRGVVYVPQGPRLFSGLTVREHLEIAIRVATTQPVQAVEEAALEPFFDDPGAITNRQVDTLSGGERQMVALARAKAMRPRLLLLDEPSIGLSQSYLDKVAGALADDEWFPRSTILMIDHKEEILRVCTKRLVLKDGRLANAT